MLPPLQPKAAKTPTWLVLTYKVPPEPAARRVALWRRLKAMGGIYLQSGVCILPRGDTQVRRLRMLANDVQDMGGEAIILETVGLDRSQEQKIIARFNGDRNEQYHEFLEGCDEFDHEMAKEMAANKYTYAELEEEDSDLKKLRAWFDRISKLDFYGASLHDEAARRLRHCETKLDAYAQMVFDAHDENR